MKVWELANLLTQKCTQKDADFRIVAFDADSEDFEEVTGILIDPVTKTVRLETDEP